jgi:MoaA/NifB/PqqE/SkfB family radical SAM enzyme
MYIQITSRCQLSCPHCFLSCGPRGIDIEDHVFYAAVDLAKQYYNDISTISLVPHRVEITIGGGEPTLHPHLWEYIEYALKITGEQGIVGIATNGLREKDAIKLANMAKEGILSAGVSYDRFHNPVASNRVLKAFKNNADDEHDLRTIITIDDEDISSNGRALKNKLGTVGCCCTTITVDVKGNIFQCGCMLNKLGTVSSSDIPTILIPICSRLYSI